MKRLTLMLAVLISMGITAQNNNATRKILDRTASVVSNSSGASANFTVSNPKSGSVKGTIYVKGRLFKAVTPEAVVWYNGKTQWSYMAQTEEVNITTPTKAQQAQMNPYTFINLYKKGYALSHVTKGTNYVVTLKSTAKNTGIDEMQITINKNTNVPSQVKMKQQGTWTTIAISNFKAAKLPGSTFVFNKKEYPDAEIVDLR